jgi:carbonic anhydrase
VKGLPEFVSSNCRWAGDANLAVPKDLGCLPAPQCAIDVLRVGYVMVVGHCGRGGVA